MEKLMESSKLTAAFRKKTFANYNLEGCDNQVRIMFDVAFTYADNFDRIRLKENNWLALLGEPGCGKTHLLAAVMNRVFEKSDTPGLYFPHVDGINELLDARFSDNREKVSAKMDELKNAPLLLWDDLLKPIGDIHKDPQTFEAKIVYEVLNYRYLNLLPTIISSERSPEGLLAMDKATGSRIMERAKGQIAAVVGFDNNYRLR
jgi:DNA replication protein DnaC